MYNNIGHRTVRGTGTNGFIQRNFAFLPKERERPVAALNKPTEAPKQRKPNKKLLERQKLRAIESEVFNLRCKLEDQGTAEEEIDAKCSELRTELKEKLANGTFAGGKAVGTHQVAEAQQRKNEILRNALKIGKAHVVGEAFDQELQEERKKTRIEERNKELTLEERLDDLTKHPLARDKRDRRDRRDRRDNRDRDRSRRDRDRDRERRDHHDRRERGRRRRREESPSPPRKRRRRSSDRGRRGDDDGGRWNSDRTKSKRDSVEKEVKEETPKSSKNRSREDDKYEKMLDQHRSEQKREKKTKKKRKRSPSPSSSSDSDSSSSS